MRFSSESVLLGRGRASLSSRKMRVMALVAGMPQSIRRGCAPASVWRLRINTAAGVLTRALHACGPSRTLVFFWDIAMPWPLQRPRTWHLRNQQTNTQQADLAVVSVQRTEAVFLQFSVGPMGACTLPTSSSAPSFTSSAERCCARVALFLWFSNIGELTPRVAGRIAGGAAC